MKTDHLLAVAFITFSSIPLLAQQAGVSAQQGASAGSVLQESTHASATTAAKPGSANLNGAAASSTTSGAISNKTSTSASATTNAASTLKAASSTTPPPSTSTAKAAESSSVSGELESKLDAKTAKVGETVVLKTTQKVTTADGTVIPKGTRLIGHVTEAQAHDSAHTDSQLGMAFDRAELRSGQSLSIHSTIESVNPRPDFTALGSMAGNDSFGTPMGGGMVGGRAMGGGRVSGGGVMGDAVERTSAATTSTREQASSATASTAHATESVARGSEHVAGNATANTAAGVHSVAASGHATASTANHVTARSTGIPGVMLRNGDSASASGTLSASKKNVHLDSGTQMDLSFAAAGK
jgi:hypothetical protein